MKWEIGVFKAACLPGFGFCFCRRTFRKRELV